jgi:hypothetical protein
VATNLGGTAQAAAKHEEDPRGVVTPIQVDAVESLLASLGILNDWSHVVKGLREGFDVGANTVLSSSVSFPNHTSSALNPKFIDSYIQEEQAAGRYSRSFEPYELEQLIGPYRTSPLGLIPKPNSHKLRLIQDFSFPRGNNPIPSVNSFINAEDFPTSWGTFDRVSELVLSLPPGSEAAAFDISAAYRITPTRPAQQHLLCITWRAKIIMDFAASFGMASSCGIFGAIADMLLAIYKAHGITRVLKWVDDFLAIRTPGESWTEKSFMDLTGRLGIPWSLEKLKPFASQQKFIGFIWDLAAKAVSMPIEKLQATIALARRWLAPRSRFSSHDAASLHGKLVHTSTIFPLIRPFLPRISRFADRFKSHRAKLSPPSSLVADLRWIVSILANTPNTRQLSTPNPFDIGWWGDASSAFGIGVVIGPFWNVWRYADGVRVGPKADFDIGWAEAIAVELGLEMATYHDVLNHSEEFRSCLLVRSDNQGIVTVLNSGRSRSEATNSVLQRIYASLARSSRTVHAVYIPSRDNIADALSRGDVAAFLAGFPGVLIRSEMPTPPHLSTLLRSL